MSNNQILRLSADYDCHPLWRQRSDGGLDNLAASSFDLALELVEGLEDWADIYDATLNQADPASSGFDSNDALERFVARGYQLAKMVAIALGQPVMYYDLVLGERVTVELGS